MIVLIVGGQRSGKSKFVEGLLQYKKDVGYIATMTVEDEEMKHRVEIHQRQRPDIWTTYEMYKDFPENLGKHDYYILECVGNMLSNILFDYTADKEDDEITIELVNEIESYFKDQLLKLIEFTKEQESDLYLITNEVGMSLTPTDKLARVYTDILGRTNQYLGEKSGEMYLVIAGQGTNIK